MRGIIMTVAGLALLGLPAAASAAGIVAGGDGVVEDPRWLPWIGCWESQNIDEDEVAPSLVCVNYLDDGNGVEIATWVNGEVLAREELRTDGIRVPVEEGGCEGEQWTEWSEDGTRLFLHSEMSCGEGMVRATRGVLAIQNDGGRWLEIHAVSAGEMDPALGVTSFRAARPEALATAGVESPDEGRRLAVNTARTLAARAMQPEDVSEAVQAVGSDVTRALIVEAGQPFRLDAGILRDLKRDGVPEEVLDVMIAVTFPERFAIQGGTQDPDYQVAPRSAEASPGVDRTRYLNATRLGFGFGYRPGVFYGGSSAYNRYGYNRYGYSPYGYSPYGYSPYGYGSSWGYPRGYWGTPVVIVRPPTAADRGRLTSDGYVGTGASARTASPRGATQGTQAAPARRPNAMPTPSTRVETPRAPAARAPASRPATPRVTPPSRSTGDPVRRATPRRGGGGDDPS